jgi:hypothetical protein
MMVVKLARRISLARPEPVEFEAALAFALLEAAGD